MKIKFLGTAAAVGLPHQFCNCDFCEKVRQIGGKNFRTRTAITIDSIYHIDFPPDSFYQSLKFDEPLHKMKYLLITHTHPDHFDLNQLFLRKAKFRAKDIGPLYIFGPKEVRKNLLSHSPKSIQEADIHSKTLKPYVNYKIGEMTVLPLKVHHDSRITCYNYLLRYENKTIYIGFDVGKLYPRSYKKLVNAKIDIAIFEYSMGDSENPYDHLNTDRLMRLIDEFRKLGAIQESTEIYLTHFSHFTNMLHSELVQRFKKHKIKIAYDGLTIEL